MYGAETRRESQGTDQGADQEPKSMVRITADGAPERESLGQRSHRARCQQVRLHR